MDWDKYNRIRESYMNLNLLIPAIIVAVIVFFLTKISINSTSNISGDIFGLSYESGGAIASFIITYLIILKHQSKINDQLDRQITMEMEHSHNVEMKDLEQKGKINKLLIKGHLYLPDGITPAEGIEVFVEHTRSTTKTDNIGSFQLEVFLVDKYVLRVKSDSYRLKEELNIPNDKREYTCSFCLVEKTQNIDKNVEAIETHKESNSDEINSKHSKIQDGYLAQRNLLIEKLNFFRSELPITYDEEKKFSLKESIKEIEKEIEELDNKIYN